MRDDDVVHVAKKTLPSFLDSEETYHFFNDEMVLRTNAIRNVEDDDDDDGGGGEEDGNAGGETGSLSEDEEEDRDVRRDLLLDVADSENEDDEEDENEEEDVVSMHRSAIAKSNGTRTKKSKQQRRLRTKMSCTMLKRNSLRSERIPDPAPMYDEIYDSFDDLYADYYAKKNDLHASPNGLDASQKRKEWEQKQRRKNRKARTALAAYTRRAFAAKSYRYRKQCEFLRVCYQRALETEPIVEERSESVLKDALPDKPVRNDGDPSVSSSSSSSSILLGVVRKDDIVETTVPVLHPRKWPHLPFRSPLLWKGNIDDAVEFLAKLGELPEASLLYEPIDVQGFTKEVLTLLEEAGVDINLDTACGEEEFAFAKPKSVELPEEAVVGLIALIGMGVQLQSFSLLSCAALHLTVLGRGASLRDGEALRPRLKSVLGMYWSRLLKYGSGPCYAATHSRGLLSQWKISACQPSSSDSIATDGLFLYVFGRSGLLKIGTGNGCTVRDFVYDHNREYTRSRDAERSWLCCIGSYLYCRTIVMPSNRVDRIATNDLSSVEELFFSPNRSVYGKAVSESSVYAMITDGVDLYTVKCIDTHKRPLQEKQDGLNAKSHSSLKSIDPVIHRILNSEQLKKDEAAKDLSKKGDGCDIQVGDRVVRGPDWKWSNQDGEKGGLGTVERISTWGGVAGSGVTVRWDKTQRVNTYRWGAEGCYDLSIVIEKDGQIIEQKKLPSKVTQKSEDGGDASAEDPPPRHQFVLYRHDVSQILSTIDLDEDDIDVFLDLSPMRAEGKEASEATPGLNIDESSQLSTLHSHTLSLRESKSSWMCDGRLAACNGDNAPKRYRCDSDCDYDLCESCLLSTLVRKETTVHSTDAPSEDQPQQPEDLPPAAETKESEETRVVGAVDPVESENRSVDASSSTLESSSFAIFHSPLLSDEESSRAKGDKSGDPKQDDPGEKEKSLVRELFDFWGGLYSRKECQVALRRNNFSLREASVWIDECASDLRKKLLVPTVNSVNLTAKSGSGVLDPVLLIAGSFYISQGQLCIVSPPGIYSAGENQSEPVKRAVSSCDAAWFFSMDSGALLLNERGALPVLLKGIPAGSPTCVDATHGSILVYSGYLNCLEVYVDPAQFGKNSHAQCPLEDLEEITTLSEMGENLFCQLHALMLQRWSFPAYKQPRAGLQDILFRTEREPVQATSKTTTSGSESAGTIGQKSKARRIKNIRGRIKMLGQIGQRDPPGYLIPFCVDFQDDGVLSLFRALTFWGSWFCHREESALDVSLCSLVKDILSLLGEISCEFDYAGISIGGEANDPSTKKLYEGVEKVLLELARGRNLLSSSSRTANEPIVQIHTKVILSAQTVLVWGVRKGLFCRESKGKMIGLVGDAIVLNLERDQSLLSKSMFDIALRPRESVRFTNELDCKYGLLRTLLYSPTDPGRIDVADFMPLVLEDFSHLISTLFNLSALEFKSMVLQNECERYGSSRITPITKVLHSLMNYSSVRLYGEKDEAFDGEPSPNESTRVNALELFDLFALTCIRYCSELVEQVESVPAFQHIDRSHLRSSFVGTILPIVVGTISNFPAVVSPDVRNKLAGLMKLIDKIGAKDGETRCGSGALGSESTASYFEGDQVVESSHPYNQNQSSFRRVIRIPGATLIHIDFDPRSCTSGEADFVFVTSGRSWFTSDRMAFAEGGIGDNGGYFFGSYSRGNWPTQGLSIVGDTVTIMLCATSQTRDNADHSEKLRWGLRCTVRGLFAAPPVSWLGDISCAVASACSLIVEMLLQSIPEQLFEVQCRKWINCRELFDCTDPSFFLDPKLLAFMREVVDNKGRGHAFLKVLAQQIRMHKSPNTSTNSTWSEALHSVAAVLVAQSDNVQLTAMLKNLGKDTFPVEGSERNLVKGIAAELQRVEQWMIRQVQLLNEWHYLQVDGVSVEEMSERYADNHDRLRELCELQNLAFHTVDVNGCIKRLHSQLHKQEAQGKEDTGSQASASYQRVANEVKKKAHFVLDRHWSGSAEEPKAVADGRSNQLPTGTIGANEFASESTSSHQPDHNRVAVAGEFFRCSLPSSAIAQCAQIHSERLKERLAGFCLSEVALSGIEAAEMRSWFVGRGLVALSSSSYFDSGYISGCMLGDRTLLAEFIAMYVDAASFLSILFLANV